MLNIRLLNCSKVELWNLTVCIAVIGEKLCRDLGPTMPNIELVRIIFIYCIVFKFHVPRSFLSYRAKTHTHINTYTHKHTHTQTDAYKD